MVDIAKLENKRASEDSPSSDRPTKKGAISEDVEAAEADADAEDTEEDAAPSRSPQIRNLAQVERRRGSVGRIPQKVGICRRLARIYQGTHSTRPPTSWPRGSRQSHSCLHHTFVHYG